MAWIGGAYKPVQTDPPAGPELPVRVTDRIAVILRALVLGFSRALNLLTVLVHSGDERDGLSRQALKPCQSITGDGRVSAAEMRSVVDVIKRRREGVRHLGVRISAARRDAGS